MLQLEENLNEHRIKAHGPVLIGAADGKARFRCVHKVVTNAGGWKEVDKQSLDTESAARHWFQSTVASVKGEEKIPQKRTHYPGGKGNVYQKLINLMPPHDVYIEGYLGAGSVMRAKRAARLNIGIDANMQVLCETAQNFPVDRTIIIGDEHRYPSTHPAVTSGIARNGDGGCRYVCLVDDFLNFAGCYSFTGNELCYCDPPYVREARKDRHRDYYEFEYEHDDHVQLLTRLLSLNCMVMISGYWSELYADMLSGWHQATFMAVTRGGSMAEEWVWMNYPYPLMLHDYQYLGANFRERERIKKKKNRLVKRLEHMPDYERQALLWAVREAGLLEHR